MPRRKLPGHEPPNWVDPASIYFITLCATQRGTDLLLPMAARLLDVVRRYHHDRKWHCHLAVVMPDHLHFLLNFPDVVRFSQVIGDYKRWTASKFGIEWQRDFFEHRLRNEESFDEKAHYILQNPVRAGLVGSAQDWPYFWQSVP
jgi:putative transposase